MNLRFWKEDKLSQSFLLTLGVILGALLMLLVIVAGSIAMRDSSRLVKTSVEGFNFKLGQDKRISHLYMLQYDGTTVLIPRHVIDQIIVEINNESQNDHLLVNNPM